MRRLFLLCLALAAGLQAKSYTLLNVSYDPTRELYAEINTAFAISVKAKSGDEVTVKQSHGGSGKQARAVIDGLPADVVTLALASDIDVIAEKAQLLPKGWAKLLPHNSTPFGSTIVFLVRKGNPKGIKDWGDLAKPGVSVITPNPKTSGGARWNFLAAWAWALKQPKGDAASAKDFVGKLYKNVPVLDSGARGSTVTFVERGIGDVLLAWENEALLAQKELGAGKVELVVPSFSILAEPPVAVLSKNADKRGNGAIAKAYLDFLYAPEAQALAAKHGYRPTDKKVLNGAKFSKLKLAKISDFGGWAKVQKEYFGENGVFDQIYKP